MCLALGNIAVVYKDLGNFKNAFNYHFKALDLEKKINDQIGIAISYINIGMAYLESKDIENAINYGEKGLDLALQLQAPDLALEANKMLSEALEKKGDLQAALFYYKAYKLLNDSITKSETAKNVAEIQTKYETGKKDKLLQESLF